jgi:hypothetical protein
MNKFGLKCSVKFFAVIVSFLIHGLADRAADRKDIRYALETIRAELMNNAENVMQINDRLVQERKSAEYLLEHRFMLDKCPADSVTFHSSMIHEDMPVTLSMDASDLLRISSVPQLIGDSKLLMQIIRAYDTCEWIASTQIRRTEARNAQLNSFINGQAAVSNGGAIDITGFMRTGAGLYAVSWVTSQPEPSILADAKDIQNAIDSIDRYLSFKRLPVRKLKIL